MPYVDRSGTKLSTVLFVKASSKILHSYGDDHIHARNEEFTMWVGLNRTVGLIATETAMRARNDLHDLHAKLSGGSELERADAENVEFVCDVAEALGEAGLKLLGLFYAHESVGLTSVVELRASLKGAIAHFENSFSESFDALACFAAVEKYCEAALEALESDVALSMDPGRVRLLSNGVSQEFKDRETDLPFWRREAIAEDVRQFQNDLQGLWPELALQEATG